MPSEMVERVALSIKNAAKNAPRGSMFEDVFHLQAWAAIRAMREPTKGMIDAGMDYDEHDLIEILGRAPTVEECQKAEWQSMIDEAIEE